MAKDSQRDKERDKAPAEAPAAAVPAPSGKKPLKVMLILAAVLLLEAGTVIVTITLSGGPAPAEGKGVEAPADAQDNMLVELLVLKDQFANQRTGRTMVYDTEIYVTVRKGDAEKLKKQIDMMQAQLATDVATIVRRADPTQLLEPTLATLNRQIKAAFDERLGRDAKGEPMIREVLIRKWIGIVAG